MGQVELNFIFPTSQEVDGHHQIIPTVHDIVLTHVGRKDVEVRENSEGPMSAGRYWGGGKPVRIRKLLGVGRQGPLAQDVSAKRPPQFW